MPIDDAGRPVIPKASFSDADRPPSAEPPSITPVMPYSRYEAESTLRAPLDAVPRLPISLLGRFTAGHRS